jgi:hypothetical protein
MHAFAPAALASVMEMILQNLTAQSQFPDETLEMWTLQPLRCTGALGDAHKLQACAASALMWRKTLGTLTAMETTCGDEQGCHAQLHIRLWLVDDAAVCQIVPPKLKAHGARVTAHRPVPAGGA